jgi:hypothetical protein
MDQNIKFPEDVKFRILRCVPERERERERETKRRKKCFCAFRLCAWNGPATLNVRFLPLLYFSTSSCFSLSHSIQLWGLDQNGNLWNARPVLASLDYIAGISLNATIVPHTASDADWKSL